MFDQLEITISNSPVETAVALVSLQPDANGVQTLAVLNISLPEQPTLLNKIPIPTAVLGDNIQSMR